MLETSIRVPSVVPSCGFLLYRLNSNGSLDLSVDQKCFKDLFRPTRTVIEPLHKLLMYNCSLSHQYLDLGVVWPTKLEVKFSRFDFKDKDTY